MILLPDFIRDSQLTYYLMEKQTRYGVNFDEDAAKRLVTFIDKRMQEIVKVVEPQLPNRPLNKTEEKLWTPPKIQFKKDGTPSATCLKWFDEVEYAQREDGDVWEGVKNHVRYILPYNAPLIDQLPMQMKHQSHLKDYFVRSGWKPTLWNFKKKDGKNVRDDHGQLIKTSPKFHDKGVLCPNLEKLGDSSTGEAKVELCKPIIEWLSLRNRRSVLLNEEKGTGWLNNPRLVVDGRLGAASSGLTNTKRQKHKVVANIPRVGSYLGKEMRSLFIPSEGKVFVGYDASGLEARNEASRSYPYDDGVYAREVMDGDIHAKNAIVFGTDRNGAKSPKYAITYGCGADKLADLLGCTKRQAQAYIDQYWQTNLSVSMHKDALEKQWNTNFKKFIFGIAGDKIVTRSPHALLNCDLQNMGAKIMDQAGIIMDRLIRKERIDANRVVYYHDEYIWECDPKDAPRVSELGVQSVVLAGEFYKLNVPLDADAKVGTNWSEVH